MSTSSFSEGGTPNRQSSKLFIVVSNLIVLAVLSGLTLPPLQKMSWRLFDLEKKIERLEQKIESIQEREKKLDKLMEPLGR